jgi:hypothetical protein
VSGLTSIVYGISATTLGIQRRRVGTTVIRSMHLAA